MKSPKHTNQNLQTNEPADETRRREFLVAAGKFATVAAALGVSRTVILGDPAPAGLTDQEKAAHDLFQYALKTGDMETAIKTYGEKAHLSEKQAEALLSLTSQDLRLLKAIQDKLLGVGGTLGYTF